MLAVVTAHTVLAAAAHMYYTLDWADCRQP
jgi:hypothetical protein